MSYQRDCLTIAVRGRSNTRPPEHGGQVAQLVEQRTENPRVGSSILSLATIQNGKNDAPRSAGPFASVSYQMTAP